MCDNVSQYLAPPPMFVFFKYTGQDYLKKLKPVPHRHVTEPKHTQSSLYRQSYTSLVQQHNHAEHNDNNKKLNSMFKKKTTTHTHPQTAIEMKTYWKIVHVIYS